MQKIARGFFITGTDTDVGKTFIAIKLLTELEKNGYKTSALKPIATGCFETVDGLRNSDALLLQQHATEKWNYNLVNPVAFEDPTAPCIAAEKTGTIININGVINQCQPVLYSNSDYVIIEGAGGWQTPINDHETMADLALAFAYPVILVVNIKLGCINHAILTADSIREYDLPFAGWIANVMDKNMLYLEETIQTIERSIVKQLLIK
jgi:dethiobiotin synthetase